MLFKSESLPVWWGYHNGLLTVFAILDFGSIPVQELEVGERRVR